MNKNESNLCRCNEYIAGFKKLWFTESAISLGLILYWLTITTAFVVLNILTTKAEAREQSNQSPPPVIAEAIERISGNRLHAETAFPAPAQGLLGLVVRFDDGRQIPVWVTEDNHIVFGEIYDLQGHKVGWQIFEATTANKLSPLPHLLANDPKLLDRLETVTLMSGEHRYYIFADPNCPVCHSLYGWIHTHRRTLATAGVGIEWVPVSVLPKSAPKAGAILKGGLLALMVNEDLYDDKKHSGGVTPLNDSEWIGKAKTNTEVLEDLAKTENRKPATPAILWFDAENRPHLEIGIEDDPQSLFRTQESHHD